MAVLAQETTRDRLYNFVSRFQIFIILLIIVVVFSALRFDSFATFANFRNVLVQAAIFSVMAVGATYVIITKGVDLSVGSVLVFSGVAAAKVMESLGEQGWPIAIVGIVVACLCGLMWGVVNGLLVAKARVPPLIATLGTMGIIQGLALILSGGIDLKDAPYVLGDVIGFGSFLGLPVLAWIAAAVIIVGGIVLRITRFGRHTYAVGSNASAAVEMGINVDRHLIKVYALAGFLAGLAGILSLARFGSTTISGHATDNLQVIAAVVIGGTSLFGGVGSVFTTAVGVFIPAVLTTGLVMVGAQSFWRDVLVGMVLIGAVYFDQIGRQSKK